MRAIDIEVAEQWDVVQTMWELERLKKHVVTFLSHTMQTMSTPRPRQYMMGSIISGDPVEPEFVHPMGEFLSTIESCADGCYRRYGEDMFRQGKLFDVHMPEDTHGRTTEA